MTNNTERGEEPIVSVKCPFCGTNCYLNEEEAAWCCTECDFFTPDTL